MVAEVNLETSYRVFCRVGRPLLLLCVSVFILFVGNSVYLLHLSLADFGRYAKPSDLKYLDYELLVALVLPTMITIYLGRGCFRQILFGSLTGGQIVVISFGAVLLTHIISWILSPFATVLPKFTWYDEFHPDQGFWSTYLIWPFLEEMLYQVAIQTNLQRFGAVFAVVVTTVIFQAGHFYGGFVPISVGLVYQLPALLMLAILRQTTKSTGAVILVHSLANFIPEFSMLR